jgi:MtN3 and saliva related transmembrane protein
MTPADAVGWSASAVLVATLLRQVHTQATGRKGHSLSRWLFVGQTVASLGFIAYSWMLRNPVFLASNLVILATAVAGQWLYLRDSRRGGRK